MRDATLQSLQVSLHKIILTTKGKNAALWLQNQNGHYRNQVIKGKTA